VRVGLPGTGPAAAAVRRRLLGLPLAGGLGGPAPDPSAHRNDRGDRRHERDRARHRPALSSLDRVFAAVGDELDILVNNAAVNPRVPLAELTAEEFDRVMTVNAKFAVLAMREAARRMRDGGRIINISTLNTVVPAPGHALYIASKAVLEQFTRVAARELGARGITVNTVSPGATDTDMLRQTNPPEALAQTAALTALQRLGRPEDVAAVVAFLAGPDAGWITGQNIRATGGLVV